jgi:hypothetical protein
MLRKAEVEVELGKYGFVQTKNVMKGVIDMHNKNSYERVILFSDEWQKLTPEIIKGRYYNPPKLER